MTMTTSHSGSASGGSRVEGGGYDTAEPDEAHSFDETYLKNLRLNNSIREIFCNRFVHMFSSYDHFLSQPHEVCVMLHIFFSLLCASLANIIACVTRMIDIIYYY